LMQVLKKGVCLDPTSGGWKLSSTSDNTWLSKIFLCQYVANGLNPELLEGDSGGPADRAHRAWLLCPHTRHMAYCDQIRSSDGFPYGSKYYPRGVTSWLWTLSSEGEPKRRANIGVPSPTRAASEEADTPVS
jgi:hypothetical protein